MLDGTHFDAPTLHRLIVDEGATLNTLRKRHKAAEVPNAALDGRAKSVHAAESSGSA